MQRLRPRLLPALLLLTLLPVAAASAATVDDLETGLAQAAASDLPLVLEFGADW